MIFAALLLAAALAPAAGTNAMVATEQHLATQTGVDILKVGGNAVDAAVAVGYALAVVDPCCGNIGGGGFMLIRMHDGRERFIDFREKAPERASRDMYLDARGNVDPEKSRKGWLAIGVPGTVMGLDRALREYGTMSRSRVMSSAIDLARNGYVVEPGDMIPFEGSPAEGYSGWAFGEKPHVGERIVQRDLGASLDSIARDGDGAFYRGAIARNIVDASQRNGGLLTMRDFADYTVDESQPVHCTYHDLDVVSAPPPSSGGVTLCEILNIISPYPLAQWGWHSPRETHYVVEAERRAYADRNAYLGDPAFVHDPIAQLLDPRYAASLRKSIAPVDPTPSKQVKPGLHITVHENDDTTHYSIVDKDGNAVAVTYTINDWFGSGVVAPHTGFFLNDEMDDFTSKPGVPNMFGLVQGERNDIQPGKRPLSSMTPTMVLRDGKLAMVTGSPGGSRIITIALETILNVFDFGMNVQQAVDAPRMHMQWLPDQIQYEPNAFTATTMNALRTDGYAFSEVPFWGSAQAIVIDPKTGMRYGGTDRRHPAGAAIGY
ncbi:MAG: gamma-glutamyltransferase [Candidatus Eremiobacteraeota bacterium]|nr:gamma-glutamyltransferase [Candidatus Eremiobacteraeota bacterium]